MNTSSLSIRNNTYIYIYPFGVLTLAKALEVLQSTNLLQSTRGAAKHKGCCTAQGLLQSTRGAAKYKGCCKAQGLLQTTRVAAKHKGCCQAHGVLLYKYICTIYIIYIYISIHKLIIYI